MAQDEPYKRSWSSHTNLLLIKRVTGKSSGLFSWTWWQKVRQEVCVSIPIFTETDFFSLQMPKRPLAFQCYLVWVIILLRFALDNWGRQGDVPSMSCFKENLAAQLWGMQSTNPSSHQRLQSTSVAKSYLDHDNTLPSQHVSVAWHDYKC